MKPHKHHDTIVAWAEGRQIQFNSRGMWEDFDPQYCPAWHAMELDWRIKPAEPERSYPVSKMLLDEVFTAFREYGVSTRKVTSEEACVIANAALRHACDNGQIVTREEFDRAVGDRRARDLAVAKAVRDSFMWIRVPITVDRFDDEYLQKVIKGVTQ